MKKNEKIFRKSIFAKADIQKGEKILLKKIEARRPGIYLKAENFKKVLNKKAKRKIFKDTPIQKNMF